MIFKLACSLFSIILWVRKTSVEAPTINNQQSDTELFVNTEKQMEFDLFTSVILLFGSWFPLLQPIATSLHK